MTKNVFEEDTKQLIIYPVGASTNQLELGATSWEKRMQNNLNSFQEPSLDAEGGGTRAQNLNQIEENHIFNALISDEFMELSDINIQNTKEDLETTMETYFKGNTRVTVEYGHITRTGYLTEYNVEEAAQNDLSTFRITFTLLVADPMSGGD